MGGADDLAVHHDGDIILAVRAAGDFLRRFGELLLAFRTQGHIDEILIEAGIVHIAVSHAGAGQVVAGQDHVAVGVLKGHLRGGAQHLHGLLRVLDIGDCHNDAVGAGQIDLRLGVTQSGQTLAQHCPRGFHAAAQFLG